MRTETINVYKLDELSAEARETAIRSQQDFLAEMWDPEFTYDYYEEKLQEAGFENAKINYSGFYSQGDGASFTADINLKVYVQKLIERYKAVDLQKVNEERKQEVKFILHYLPRVIKLENEFNFRVVRFTTRYVHENTCCVESNHYHSHQRLDALREKLKSEIEFDRINFCREIYRDLKMDYEAQTDEAAAIASIEANEYEYTADGKIF